MGTQVQKPFESGTPAGPFTWIWAAGEHSHLYSVAREHQGIKVYIKWDPANSTDKKEGQTGSTTDRKWSPCDRAPPTQSTLQKPGTGAKSTMRGPGESPKSEIARQPQLTASSTSPTPDKSRARKAAHNGNRSQTTKAHGSLHLHQHPQQTPCNLRALEGRHAANHAPVAPPAPVPPQIPGTSSPQRTPTRTTRSLGPRGEHLPRPLAARGAPTPQGISLGTHPQRPRDTRPPRNVRVRETWRTTQCATHALPFR